MVLGYQYDTSVYSYAAKGELARWKFQGCSGSAWLFCFFHRKACKRNRTYRARDSYCNFAFENDRRSDKQNVSQEPSKRHSNDIQTTTIEEKKEGKKRNKEKNTKKEFFLDDEKLNQTFADFVDMRKQIKAPMTDRAVGMAIKKLTELSGGNSDTAVKILEQSIMNSWKGLFPLKDNKASTQNKFNNFTPREQDFEALERKLLGG